VAKDLNISLRTVKMYRGFLKDKLNLNSAVDVARFYDRHKHALEEKIKSQQ
jgi:DNA-binding NarL/FixJ family response regulator